LKAETSKTYGGYAWWIVEPLLELSVYYLLFKIILNRGGDDYISFLFCGILTWKWLAQVIKVSSNAIVANKGLVLNFSTKKIVYPLIDITVYTIRFLVIFMPTVLVIGVIYKSTNLLYLFPSLVSELILISGVGIFLSSIVPFLPDMIKLIPVGLRVLFYPSGIIFDVNTLSPSIKSWVLLNPIVGMVGNFRFAAMGKGQFNWHNFLLVIFIGTVFALLGLRILNNNDKKYGKMGF